MRNELVTTALELYIETLPLDAEGCDIVGQAFHDLYAKECRLFDLLRQMTWEEGEEYRYRVRCYNIDNSISNNEPEWDEEMEEWMRKEAAKEVLPEPTEAEWKAWEKIIEG